MNNPELARLNFSILLHYSGGQPPVENVYRNEVTCSGFCIECETAGILEGRDDVCLYRMSHGCDSSDYEEVLGQFVPSPDCTNEPIEEPVMFVLESPGPEDKNGKECPFEQIKKWPPVKTYYFAPDHSNSWARTSIESLRDKNFADYFCFLMTHFNLRNVYITNMIKCGKSPTSNPADFLPYDRKDSLLDSSIFESCYSHVLSKEIAAFDPKVIFAVGNNANWYLKKKYKGMSGCLHHPSARISMKRKFTENIKWMRNVLVSAGLYNTK